MNPANATSAAASATTSTGTTSARHDKPADSARASAHLTEAQYLEQQASVARAAIAGAFGELKSDLARGADPRVWMKSHPWITLASAAVAGFAAATVAVPTKEQQALRKLEAIERATNAARQPAANGNGVDSHKHPGGFLSMLIHELIAILKPILVTFLAAQFNPGGPAAEKSKDDEEKMNAER